MDKTWFRLILVVFVTVIALAMWEIMTSLLGFKSEVSIAVNPVDAGLVPIEVDKILGDDAEFLKL